MSKTDLFKDCYLIEFINTEMRRRRQRGENAGKAMVAEETLTGFSPSQQIQIRGRDISSNEMKTNDFGYDVDSKKIQKLEIN